MSPPSSMLHLQLFEEGFTDRHNTGADVEARARWYSGLRKRGTLFLTARTWNRSEKRAGYIFKSRERRAPNRVSPALLVVPEECASKSGTWTPREYNVGPARVRVQSVSDLENERKGLVTVREPGV